MIFYYPKVEFPEKHWLPEHLMFQLERLLPARDEVVVSDDMEEVTLSEADSQSQQRGSSREAYFLKLALNREMNT